MYSNLILSSNYFQNFTKNNQELNGFAITAIIETVIMTSKFKQKNVIIIAIEYHKLMEPFIMRCYILAN